MVLPKMRVLAVGLIWLGISISVSAQPQFSQSIGLEASHANSQSAIENSSSILPPAPVIEPPSGVTSSQLSLTSSSAQEGCVLTLLDTSVAEITLYPQTKVNFNYSQPTTVIDIPSQLSTTLVTAVPEPSTMAFGGLAIGSLAMLVAKKKLGNH